MCEGVHALVASIEGQATQSNLLISDILRVYSGIQLEVLTGLVSAIPEGHAIGVVLLVAEAPLCGQVSRNFVNHTQLEFGLSVRVSMDLLQALN